MSLALAAAFLALAVVALAGAARALIEPAWSGPFPLAMMAGTGVGLALLGIGWLLIRAGRERWIESLVGLGALLGMGIGIIGIFGTVQIAQDWCIRAPVAALAASLPPGDCASAAPSLLLGAYLIAIGLVSAGSLVAMWRRT